MWLMQDGRITGVKLFPCSYICKKLYYFYYSLLSFFISIKKSAYADNLCLLLLYTAFQNEYKKAEENRRHS